MKEVMIVTGARQISMAIARRMGYDKKIVLGDKNMENCRAIAKIMTDERQGGIYHRLDFPV